MADAIKVKVVILGDTCVGKSCFLMRFVNNAVTQNHISTIGVDVRNKTLVTKKGKVQDKKNLEVFHLLILETQIVSFSYMISLIKKHLIMLQIGWLLLINIRQRIYQLYL